MRRGSMDFRIPSDLPRQYKGSRFGEKTGDCSKLHPAEGSSFALFCVVAETLNPKPLRVSRPECIHKGSAMSKP